MNSNEFFSLITKGSKHENLLNEIQRNNIPLIHEGVKVRLQVFGSKESFNSTKARKRKMTEEQLQKELQVKNKGEINLYVFENQFYIEDKNHNMIECSSITQLIPLAFEEWLIGEKEGNPTIHSSFWLDLFKECKFVQSNYVYSSLPQNFEEYLLNLDANLNPIS